MKCVHVIAPPYNVMPSTSLAGPPTPGLGVSALPGVRVPLHSNPFHCPCRMHAAALLMSLGITRSDVARSVIATPATVPSGTLCFPPPIQTAALATGLIPSSQLCLVPADIYLPNCMEPAAQPLDITVIPLHQLMVSEASGYAIQIRVQRKPGHPPRTTGVDFNPPCALGLAEHSRLMGFPNHYLKTCTSLACHRPVVVQHLPIYALPTPPPPSTPAYILFTLYQSQHSIISYALIGIFTCQWGISNPYS